jgi:hypothetical protein
MVEEYLAGGPQTTTLAGDVRLDDLDVDVILALTDNDISLEYGLATFERSMWTSRTAVVDAALIGDTPDAALTGRDQGQPADAGDRPARRWYTTGRSRPRPPAGSARSSLCMVP